MISSVLAIILAANPGLPPAVRAQYARALHAECTRYGLSSTVVARLITSESRWRPRAVSPDGRDIGLGQVRLLRGRPGKRELLDPAVNLKWTVRIAAQWKRVCGDKWISGYKGYGCKR